MDYYKRMSAQLDTFQLDTALQNGHFFKAGWAKKNITPKYMPDLAGYGIREKANCLHDSVFVSTFVFDNGKNKAAFITVDLLIFPPVIEKRLLLRAKELGYSPQNLYFSATHTHSAPGGWAEGAAGTVLAGSYKEEYVNSVFESIIASIKSAEANLEEAETGIGLFNGTMFVRNRINMKESKIDPWIRVLKIRKKSGAQAALVAFSAHANCLKMNYSCVSGDYPSEMIDEIKSTTKMDFVMYCAGMVGSHIPQPIKNTYSNYLPNGKSILLDSNNIPRFVDYKRRVKRMPLEDLEDEAYISTYGENLGRLIALNLDSIKLQSSNVLASATLELPLRAPHLKISENWRVRPWVFDLLFGDYHPTIKLLKINNVLFIGTPCDFSGELMPDFYDICKEKNITLVVTSFNGGYIGYINADKYYDLNKAETRDMNWFGPYNQAYFTEIIQRILKKI